MRPKRENDSIVEFRGEYRFLSNFWQISEGITVCLKVDGSRNSSMLAPTVEHLYQAAKSFSIEERHHILSANTPGRAKRLGDEVFLKHSSLERRLWESSKEGLMRYLVEEKFKKDPLRSLLLKTEDSLIIEGNTWHDTYWGVCYCGDCPIGENRLGNILMVVRDGLKFTKNT